MVYKSRYNIVFVEYGVLFKSYSREVLLYAICLIMPLQDTFGQYLKRLLILLSFADENGINTFYKLLKIESMEVVTIEKRTFSYICERFTEFAKRIESLCSTHTQKVENWLDSQEVCLLLGFSKRTLQYYRSSGRLAYSQIGSKIYYKSTDIERIIANSETQHQSPKQITPYEKN